MQTEDTVLNDRGQWQVVEERGEVLPDIRVAVLSQALIVEAVHLRDLFALVVATENRDSAGVANLEAHEQGNCLDRVVATIDVVSHEEIVVLGQLAADVEQFFKIEELSVDVTTNGDRRANRSNIAFLH